LGLEGDAAPLAGRVAYADIVLCPVREGRFMAYADIVVRAYADIVRSRLVGCHG
jgi:hypothetical protein